MKGDNLEFPTQEERAVILEALIQEKGLARQHIDSFEKFVEEDLQRIIDEVGGISVLLPDGRYQIKFGKVRLGQPQIRDVSDNLIYLTPRICRISNLTYSAPIYLEMYEIKSGGVKIREEVEIGSLPIMVKSKYCVLHGKTTEELAKLGEDPYDPGGYLIVNGSERVVVGLEDLAPNKILTDIKDMGSYKLYVAKVFSSTAGYRTRVEVRYRSSNEELKVYLPGVAAEIPFIIMVKALGLTKDVDIANEVSPFSEVQDLLSASFEDAEGIFTEDEAILFIGNRIAHGQPEQTRRARTANLLDAILLPHLGNTSDKRIEKARYLCEMANRVLTLRLGWRTKDDKDHYGNKRLRLAGSIFATLFRAAFRRLIRDMHYTLSRSSLRHIPIKPAALVTKSIITDRLSHAIATGNIGGNVVGVTQLLDRTNRLSTLSHLRRVQSLLSRSQPNFEARDLHPTHWGRIDPNETPEGSNCGLVKNLSMDAVLSVGADEEELKEKLYTLGVVPYEKANPELRKKAAKVFINGTPVGFSTSPKQLVKEVKRLRRGNILLTKNSSEVNIAYYVYSSGPYPIEEICVNCDAGRVRRPLLIVENEKPKLQRSHIEMLRKGEMSWSDLIYEGIIELLDAEEEENALIALDYDEITGDTTHMEISPIFLFGVTTSVIPFAEHNQSPRNSYEAAMSKQALGYPFSNIRDMFLTRTHLLHYPQKPLVETFSINLSKIDKRPIGQNFIVAVLSHPYNMEDALVLNKASVERGLARSTTYRVYEAETRTYSAGDRDRIERPDPNLRGYRGDEFYVHLEEDGLISVETPVKGGDVLIGRTSPPRFFEEYRELAMKTPTRRDTSVALAVNETGIVDAVVITEPQEPSSLVIKVRVRDTRIPEVGDKFASRHGQKGVVGLLVPQEDMPFTESGIVPDALLNPHAIPSRMTVGHFLESMTSKAAAAEGKILSGTPFIHTPVEEVRKLLIKHGFHPAGHEVMINGITGEVMETEIFIGMVYYQRLHHMVKDKIHARARGQIQLLTHQPTEGRARGGGLRFGEMERDCLVGHGAARLLLDRLLEKSDKTVVYICETCGHIGYLDARRRQYVCPICGPNAKLSAVSMSYAFKLLLQELTSMCILPRIKLKERV